MQKPFLPLALFVVILAISACAPQPAQPAEVTLPSQPAELIAEGLLMPVNDQDQSFSIPGQVAEVLVQDGDRVTVGQVLARLSESPDARAVLARAQQEALLAQQALDGLQTAARVNLAQSKLAVIAAQQQLEQAEDRYNADESEENLAELDAARAALQQAEDSQARLESGAGIDPDQLAGAQARLEAANAAVASAQAALEALELKATLDGILVDTSLKAGQRVSAGQPVLTLADFSSWVVKTDNLTEIEVVQLEIGQAVEVVLDALPDVILAGEVTHINTRYEEKRGDITYTVTVRLNQSDPRMRWGMTAAVQFAQ